MLKDDDDDKVCVKWENPGSLLLLAGGSSKAICKVELQQPLPNDILMVEASTTNTLPAGMLLQSIVIPSNAVDVNKFTVIVQNESLKDATIPVGTVLGRLCKTDVATTVPQSESEEFDASLIKFGESPVPEEWKARLCQ